MVDRPHRRYQQPRFLWVKYFFNVGPVTFDDPSRPPQSFLPGVGFDSNPPDPDGAIHAPDANYGQLNG